jgi:hypothetical protein
MDKWTSEMESTANLTPSHSLEPPSYLYWIRSYAESRMSHGESQDQRHSAGGYIAWGYIAYCILNSFYSF